MSKKTLLIALLVLVNFVTKAQNKNTEAYLPMAVENAQWTIFVSDEDNLPPFNEYFYGYRIQGDTIINGITYKKVYKRDFEPVNPDLGNPLVGPFVAVNETLFGAIRDDIPNKKVFGIRFCPFNPGCFVCDEEFLMYDFNMIIDDSYDEFCLVVGFGYYLGDYTQEVIFNQNRIVQNIYDDIGDTFLRIYEGFGGDSGLFEGVGIPLGCPCVSLDNYCIGTDQECLEGFILSNNENIIKNKINIYPNPVQNVLNIENLLQINFKKITIYTLLGKEVKTIKSDNIDVSKLEKGVYTIRIITKKGKSLTKKIIKS